MRGNILGTNLDCRGAARKTDAGPEFDAKTSAGSYATSDQAARHNAASSSSSASKTGNLATIAAAPAPNARKRHQQWHGELSQPRGWTLNRNSDNNATITDRGDAEASHDQRRRRIAERARSAERPTATHTPQHATGCKRRIEYAVADSAAAARYARWNRNARHDVFNSIG